MSEVEAIVERVLPLRKAQDGTMSWWAVKLKGREGVFALNQNWIALYGSLKPDDRVRYVVSKAKLGQDPLFDKLTRISEEEERWEEAEPEL